MMDRRHFLGGSLAALLPLTGRQAAGPQADSGTVAPAVADPLRNPYAVGRLRDSLRPIDSDPVVIAIERRLRCTCGCTLDVYTCRTTDFTCTYSPAMHREVVTLYTDGQTPEQILASFVAREGEAILMAPPAEGFNLVGYLLPGLAVAAGGLALLAWIGRRRAAVAAAGASPAAPEVTAAGSPPDDDQRARLQRTLDDVES